MHELHDLETIHNESKRMLAISGCFILIPIFVLFFAMQDSFANLVKECLDNNSHECCECKALASYGVDLQMLKNDFVYQQMILDLKFGSSTEIIVNQIEEINQSLSKYYFADSQVASLD